MEIQEIHIRFGRVIPNNQPPYPPKELEDEKEEIAPKANPPYFPERLIQPNQHTPEETKLLGELKKLCVKIPLLQAIKNVPIYNNIIKDKWFEHLWRRNKDIPTINVIGQLSDLMSRRVICPNYLDPRSIVVDVHIDGIIVPRTLINIGAPINVMTKETMIKLNLQGSLRKTTTVMKLADRSIVTPEGVGEDVMVYVDSWDYPIDLLVL